jgi:hypothetical protein
MKYNIFHWTHIDQHNANLGDIDRRLTALENPVDYQAKYNELRATIQEQLKILKPWYQNGNVNNPMDAVEALKAIDKAVNL